MDRVRPSRAVLADRLPAAAAAIVEFRYGCGRPTVAIRSPPGIHISEDCGLRN